MGRLGKIRLSEIAVILILAFFGMAGSIPGIAPNQANEMTGAAVTRLQTVAGVGSQLLINGLILCLLFVSKDELLRRAKACIWAGPLAFWALLSMCWSQEPLLTARRAVPFALATAFGMYLALLAREGRLLQLLQFAFVLLACWSAVLALGFPAIGLDASSGHGGDWQGVFTQKNACGRAMVFALASVLAMEPLSPMRLALCLLFGTELILSGSRGAWLLGLVVCGALLIVRASCRLDRAGRSAFLAGTAVVSMAAAAVAVSEFANLAALLGRDPTLTGRTAIWHEVWLAILRHPVLGYGFSAFWRGTQGASWSVVVALRFVLFHAHNGFLEIWLELGACGLLLFAAGFLRASWLLWPELRDGHYGHAAWPLSVLLLVAFYDVDENTFLSFNGLFSVLYASALVQIELLALDRRRAAERSLFQDKKTLAVPAWPPAHVPWVMAGSREVSVAARTSAGSDARSPWL